MTKGVTIIICTYNGADRLGKTIEHIARQSLTEVPWEVILVDNASTDNSSAVGQSEWDKYKICNVSFSVINEPKPGKLYAMQKAIKAAQYEYMITCDDDNWLAPDYAKRIYDTFESTAEVAAIGGRGIPVTEGQPLPDWFKNYEVVYAVGPQAKKHGIMPVRSILWGAGLSTRRSVYLEMYKTYPSFLIEHDVDIIFAEDTEYCLRLILKGYRLFYDADLVYHHFIADYKLDIKRRDAYLGRFKDANVVLRKYYAAMRAKLKTKGRPDIWLLLLLITPFNYIFSFSRKRAEKARNTLFHMLPFGIKSDPISTRIKAFIKE
ncbi:MAG: glycosyltransferase family 2 protein [Pedobacter sp.]|uniref:glycosyltransferase n=1 Tax=Pedobacter sp. TaxID=1411316 RepID=UPI0033991CE7